MEMFEPLGVLALLNFSEKEKQDMERIYNEYKYEFNTDKTSDIAVSLTSLFSSPILTQTEMYYNGELISSYAICKALLENKASDKVVAFYFENLLFRVISFWEYIYHFINQHFHLELFDNESKRKEIEKACYRVNFIEKDDGYKVEYLERPEEEQKEIKKKLRRRIKTITKKNILNKVYEQYEVGGNLKRLMEYIENNGVENIKTIRNQIMHQRPAGAFSTVEYGMFGYSYSHSKKGWIDFHKELSYVDECIEILKESVQTLHEILYLGEYPNLVKNAGVEYFVHKVQCKACKHEFVAPSLFVQEDSDGVRVFCPQCGEIEVEMMKKTRVIELDHNSCLTKYMKSLK